MNKTFYLASGFPSREGCKAIVSKIENETKWVNTASWITDDEHILGDAKKLANTDQTDLYRAGIVIVLPTRSSKGGKWVELGMAIALKKPVYYVNSITATLDTPPDNIFLYLSGVTRVDNIEELIVKMKFIPEIL